VTQFAYDSFGNLQQVVDALGQITSYQYNANGWLTREVKADGQAIDYRWDDAQRLVGIAAPDETVTYRYVYTEISQI